MSTKIKDMPLYSTLEVSQKLNVTRVTIRKYLKQGKLKGKKEMGKWCKSDNVLGEFFRSP